MITGSERLARLMIEEILQIALDAGVKKVIPHIYSSIIGKSTGDTRPEDVKALLEIVKKLMK